MIRTDASRIIGSGHVVRCLTLAERLRKLGSTVEFITRNHLNNLDHQIKSKGFKVRTLSNSTTIQSFQKNITEPKYWLGVKQEVDAEETIKIVKNKGLEWLIIDHYAIEHKWEKKLRPYTKKIMVIDDLANRYHDCDILLDQNMVAKKNTRYIDKIPGNCLELLGPKYALLQPIYADYHKKSFYKHGRIKCILIFFGGVDRYNLTGRAIAAFLDTNRTDIDVDVVMPARSQYIGLVQKQISNCYNIRLHSDIPTLAGLMLKADLAIGSGGATSWERLCLKLPALVITFAKNQENVTNKLHELRVVRCLGDYNCSKEDIVYALKNEFDMHKQSWFKLEDNNFVDGLGVNRAVDKMRILY